MTDFHPSEADDQVFPELFTPEKIEQRRLEQEKAWDEPEICDSCNGSGLGQFDGWTCSSCNGKGVRRLPPEPA